MELSLSPNYFIFDNHTRFLENSGPTGLALIVVISEAFLQRLEDKTIPKALTTNLAPLTYKGYLNDTHATFERTQQSRSFVHKAIQYTMEKENHILSKN